MRLIHVIFSIGAALGAIGCGTTDNIGDCHALCDRYKDCHDPSYSVVACYTSCRASSERDVDFARKVDVCRNCLDAHTCTVASFPCPTECAGIAP